MMLRGLSIRAKLTAAFAAALLLVLALAGLFVYLRVSSQLTEALDDGLESRVNDVESLLARSEGQPPKLTGGLFEGEEGFAQILTPNGKVVASTQQQRTGPAIDPAQVHQATDGPVVADRDVPGLDAQARILAEPATFPEETYVIVAGASTGDRDEALAGIAGAFAIGAPLALQSPRASATCSRAARWRRSTTCAERRTRSRSSEAESDCRFRAPRTRSTGSERH